MALSKVEARKRRHRRVRKKVMGMPQKPRLVVFKSLKHIYAQLVDDIAGKTIASASTLDKDIRSGNGNCSNVVSAKKVGAAIAQKALSKNITQVVFDRGGYKYHGCVKALADAAREQGLKF